jgi:hypothetical protein
MKQEFFSHDLHGRNDGKLQRVLMKHGLKGIGAFWCIVEMLYENEGVLMRTECERIAFELRVDCDFISSMIDDFELFQNDGDVFYSKSVLTRLETINAKRDKAKKSAEIRWGYANALRTQSDGNAVKESKEKKIIDIEKDKTTRFVKPNRDDVRKYMIELDMSDLSQRFVDYYESNGWRVGKNPMKDWKACVRTWKQQNNEKPKTTESFYKPLKFD